MIHKTNDKKEFIIYCMLACVVLLYIITLVYWVTNENINFGFFATMLANVFSGFTLSSILIELYPENKENHD